MRENHDLSFDIDRFLEDAARAKQQLDVERWREELRPRALRLFAARTTKLQWTRALLKLVVRELHPDDLFSELIGNLDRVPRRRWPQVAALAVALRHSWRQNGLAQIVKSLHVPRQSAEDNAPTRHPKHSRRSTRKSSPSKRERPKPRRTK